MANEPPKPPIPATLAASPPVGSTTTQIRNLSSEDFVAVYQHSNLFYWWPVWAFGFLFALITYFGDDHMAIVPAGTKAMSSVDIGDGTKRDVLVLKENAKHLTRKNEAGQQEVAEPTIYVTRYRALGTIYLFILLIVIFVTNIALRGQWSLVIVIVMMSVAIIFWLAGFWEFIFERLGNMSIYINLGGYMMISLVVFILWMLNFFIFDRQIYVIVTPGRVRLCLEIGSGETIYDTFGMVVERQRADLFRHVILGFGSGDLIFRFNKIEHPIHLSNVLNVTKVLKRIEQLSKEKIIVTEDDSPPPPANPPAKA